MMVSTWRVVCVVLFISFCDDVRPDQIISKMLSNFRFAESTRFDSSNVSNASKKIV